MDNKPEMEMDTLRMAENGKIIKKLDEGCTLINT